MSKITSIWEDIKTQLRRGRYFFRRDYLTASNIVNILTILGIAFFTFQALNKATQIWSLEEKLNNMKLDVARMKIEIETLELEKQYHASEEYKELIARAKQGKMVAGETMVILPENSSEAKNKYKTSETTVRPYRSNFSMWLEFLFG